MCISFIQLLYNYHKTVDLKRQKCILSEFWRPFIWNQGVGRAALSLEGSGRKSVLAFSNFWVAPNVPWLLAISLQSLPLWSHCLLFCVISFCLTLIRTFVIGFRAPVIIQNDLKILNLITSAMILFSKKGHIHKLQGLRYRHIFLGLPYNPLQYGVSIHILLLTHFIF